MKLVKFINLFYLQPLIYILKLLQWFAHYVSWTLIQFYILPADASYAYENEESKYITFYLYYFTSKLISVAMSIYLDLDKSRQTVRV